MAGPVARVPRPGDGVAAVVRLDSDGDVLLAGPAVRAVARGASRVVLVVSPAGRQAAGLLPGVDRVVEYAAPWSGYAPPPVDAGAFAGVVGDLAAEGVDRAVVLTSYHQSPLPAALVLRLAGARHVTAASEDYPGSLLSVRHRRPDDGKGGLHEVERALDTVRAAGFGTDGDDGLHVEVPPPAGSVAAALPEEDYVVVVPTASVPARTPSPATAAGWVAALRDAGHAVVVTGAPGEEEATAAAAAGGAAVDLGGRTGYGDLAAVLAGARAVVSPNTGSAHLAAAVGTPVVSAFAPVVPWSGWRPWGVPTARLGDQGAACAGTRARTCPVPGHPCLDGIDPAAVVDAVGALAAAAPRRSASGPAAPSPGASPERSPR